MGKINGIQRTMKLGSGSKELFVRAKFSTGGKISGEDRPVEAPGTGFPQAAGL